ncbi:MAG: heme-binding protein [Akkermansiaceae bacterium]|nr:heme-binding protein [Akkermansiaceae bacterium]
MKKKFYPLFALIAACHLHAEDKVDQPASYVDEAPLPENWPAPGPYGEVSEKKYPSYRAAFTDGKGESSAFWTLFLHIKKHDIPMTAPVEMPLEEDGEQLRQGGMAFLYQNGKVGNTGPDGTKVEVRDVPATRALSYAWQGDDGKKEVATARAELEKVLDEKDIEAKGFRLLGYNGPGTPRDKRTWELQAILGD